MMVFGEILVPRDPAAVRIGFRRTDGHTCRPANLKPCRPEKPILVSKLRSPLDYYYY